MSKKLIVSCMTIAAFAAFGAASIASASPVLTHPTGTAAPIGTKFTATNIGETVFTAGSTTWTCSKDLLTGTITRNNGTEIEGTIENASFKGTETEERCAGSLGATKFTTSGGAGFNGTPWCFKLETNAAKEDILTIRGNSCANAARSITFAFDLTIFGGPV